MSCCAGNIEFEEDELVRRDGEDDNECTLMTEDELIELDESVKPVRLTKISVASSLTSLP